MRRILIFFLIQLSMLLSQSIDEIFNDGNQFYNEKKYKKASLEYEKILDKDFFSEDLYLNLGNAYFQISEHGSARWSYEMGLKLNPRNADLVNNNNVNKNYIQNHIEVPKNNMATYNFNKGYTLFSSKNYKKARPYLEKVKNNSKYDSDAHYYFCLLYTSPSPRDRG